MTNGQPLLAEIRPNVLWEILEQSDPKAIRWWGKTPPAYWDMLMFNIGMQLAVTSVDALPGYVELLQELELD